MAKMRSGMLSCSAGEFAWVPRALRALMVLGRIAGNVLQLLREWQALHDLDGIHHVFVDLEPVFVC